MMAVFSAVMLLALLGPASAIKCWVGTTMVPDVGHNNAPVLTSGFASCLEASATAYVQSFDMTVVVTTFQGVVGREVCAVSTAAFFANPLMVTSYDSSAAKRGLGVAKGPGTNSYCYGPCPGRRSILSTDVTITKPSSNCCTLAGCNSPDGVAVVAFIEEKVSMVTKVIKAVRALGIIPGSKGPQSNAYCYGPCPGRKLRL